MPSTRLIRDNCTISLIIVNFPHESRQHPAFEEPRWQGVPPQGESDGSGQDASRETLHNTSGISQINIFLTSVTCQVTCYPGVVSWAILPGGGSVSTNVSYYNTEMVGIIKKCW